VCQYRKANLVVGTTGFIMKYQAPTTYKIVKPARLGYLSEDALFHETRMSRAEDVSWLDRE
jgi:hypothetical protein